MARLARVRFTEQALSKALHLPEGSRIWGVREGLPMTVAPHFEFLIESPNLPEVPEGSAIPRAGYSVIAVTNPDGSTVRTEFGEWTIYID